MKEHKSIKDVIFIDATIVALILAFIFLLTAFIMGTIDFISWGAGARFGMVFIGCVVSGVTLAIKHDVS